MADRPSRVRPPHDHSHRRDGRRNQVHSKKKEQQAAGAAPSHLDVPVKVPPVHTAASDAPTQVIRPRESPSSIVVVGVIGESLRGVETFVDHLLDGQNSLSKWQIFRDGRKVMPKAEANRSARMENKDLERELSLVGWSANLLSFRHFDKEGVVYLHLGAGIGAEMISQAIKGEAGKSRSLTHSSYRCKSGEIATKVTDSPLEIGDNWLQQWIEERENEVQKAMLLVFSVSHVVLFIQDSPCFDPQLLQTFRLLQMAKNATFPNLPPQTVPVNNAESPLPLQGVNSTMLKQPAQGAIKLLSRGGGRGNIRSPLVIPLPGPSALPHVLLPGHCSPVLVLLYPEEPNLEVQTAFPASAAEAEDVMAGPARITTSAASIKHEGGEEQPQFTILLSKHSGSGVSAPATKFTPIASNKSAVNSAAAAQRKVQAAMEGQIRQLLRKCKALGTSEPGGLNSHGMLPQAAGPLLFHLDPFRVVLFVDKARAKPAAALEATTAMLEDIFTLCANADDFTKLDKIDNQMSSPTKDFQSVRDFVQKHVDFLRGARGVGGGVDGTQVSRGHGGAVAPHPKAGPLFRGLTSRSSMSLQFAQPELPSWSAWATACQDLSDRLAVRNLSIMELANGETAKVNK